MTISAVAAWTEDNSLSQFNMDTSFRWYDSSDEHDKYRLYKKGDPPNDKSPYY